jgi:WD40-like Beta Propeller Repeat
MVPSFASHSTSKCPSFQYRLAPEVVWQGTVEPKGPGVTGAPDNPCWAIVHRGQSSLLRLHYGRRTRETGIEHTPDGRTIVFFRRDGDVYSVAANGANLRRLTKGNGYVEFRLSDKDRHGSSDGPAISPDGKRIAYVAVKDGVPNVCTMNLDGSDQKQVTFRKSRCGRVRWAPDGKQLAFVSFEGRWPQLFVVSAAGGEARQLTKVKGAVYFLDLKPSAGK